MIGSGDFISREAFKQEVRKLSTHYLNEWDTLGVLAAADRIPAADVVPLDYHERCLQIEVEKRLALEMQMPRWIPVSERLPEVNKYVLGCFKDNSMTSVCFFDRDEHMTFWRACTDEGWEADCDSEPTHWMPLPGPPEEE